MKNINHYMLPKITDSLYSNEARSAIALSKGIAEKVNEIVDALNKINNERISKYLEQDGKIQGGILYMKDNLANTLYDMLELMKNNGEFDSIVKDIIEPAIAMIERKTDNIVSVNSFGAVGDGVTDNTDAIQKAIDYAFEHNKTVVIPAGTYLIKNTLKLYEHQTISGVDRQHTIIKKVGSTPAISFVRSTNYVFDYTEGQKVTDLTISCDNSGVGIYSELSCPYIQIDNVNINECSIGIYLFKGCWVSTISNVSVWRCATGIKINASSTSTHLENTYVMYATDIAYDIEGMTYSEWANVCADWCTGTVYKFNFCTIKINGMGCECVNAVNPLHLNNSRIAISSAYIFALENETATYIIGNASQLTIENSSIGGNGESKGKFCNSRVKFDLELKNCKLNGIDATSTSEYAFNTTKFDTGRSFYLTTLDDKFSYIGKTNNDVIEPEKIGYDIPMPAIYGNVMGDVLVGENIENRQWKQVKKAGDIFINQAPGNHIAFYQQITDADTYYSNGIITAITGNVITVNTDSFGIASEKRGTTFAVGGTLYNKDKEGSKITAVDLDNLAITVEDGSIFNLNEHFYYKPDITFMKDAEYRAVQHITVGTTGERPVDAPIGFMFYDVNMMQPIWKTATGWKDANGDTV